MLAFTDKMFEKLRVARLSRSDRRLIKKFEGDIASGRIRRPKIGIYGNCQAKPFGACLRACMPWAEIWLSPKVLGRQYSLEDLSECDMVFIQSAFWDEISAKPHLPSTKIKFPTVYFSGYFPDILIQEGPNKILSAGGIYNSAIALYGFVKGLSIEQTAALYCQEVYVKLGFYDHYRISKEKTIADLNGCGLDGERLFAEWASLGVPFYTPNHPKTPVFWSIAKAVIDNSKLGRLNYPDPVRDNLALFGEWPIYPEFATIYGLEGGSMTYQFVTGNDGVKVALSLVEFIALSFEKYKERGITTKDVDMFARNPEIFDDLESSANSRTVAAKDDASYDKWLFDMAPFTPPGMDALQVASKGVADPLHIPIGNARVEAKFADGIGDTIDQNARLICEEELLDLG